MSEITKPIIDCPESVIRAGARLSKLRLLAEELEREIDAAFPDIRAAIDHVVVEYGARRAQAGEALALLRTAQAAPGNIAHAHNILRMAIVSRGIAEPTGKQIVAMMTEIDKEAEKAAPHVDPESIR